MYPLCVPRVQAYLDLLSHLQADATSDGILTARTWEHQARGEMVLEMLADAMVPLQRQLEGAGVSILEPAPFACLAMLNHMASHVATWMLGWPAGEGKAPMPAAAGCAMPPVWNTFHQIAAAASV